MRAPRDVQPLLSSYPIVRFIAARLESQIPANFNVDVACHDIFEFHLRMCQEAPARVSAHHHFGVRCEPPHIGGAQGQDPFNVAGQLSRKPGFMHLPHCLMGNIIAGHRCTVQPKSSRRLTSIAV